MKRGFTIVELLATILVLGIIALVATPIVLNVVGDAKESSDLSNAKMYVKSINNTLAKERVYNSNIENGLYEINENGEICLNGNCIEIDASGKMPDSGTIEIVSNEAICGYNMHYGSTIITCDENNNLVKYEEGKCYVVNPKSFGSSCTYIDLDSSSSITIGDKVTCGTEGFYVINPSGDDNKVYMLAEWNLNVKEAGYLDELETDDQDQLGLEFENIDMHIPYSYTYCKSKAGYQDSHVIASISQESSENFMTFSNSGTTLYVGYGMLLFDKNTQGDYGYWTTGDDHQLNTSVYTENTNGGYPAYVYDSNSTLKPFVDSYVRKLNNSINGANATGRLIKYEELLQLGCDSEFYSCNNSWVKQTFYWTGTAYSNGNLWASNFTLNIGGNNPTSMHPSYNSLFVGVRPVIEINSSVIKNNN